MELLQLKYFCDAAETENFSKTAKKFNVPQSNISQSIKRLEDELNTSLFTRRANSLFLNEAGRDFYKKISQALHLIYDATDKFKGKNLTGIVNISVNCNRRIVLNAIEEFKRAFPDVLLKTTYFGDFHTDDYNVIIDSEDSSYQGYEKIELLSEKIDLAVNKNNPLSSKKALDAATLKTEHFITMDKKTSHYKVTYEICSNLGFKPHVALQSDDPTFVQKCVELNLGVTIVPTVSWQGQFSDDIVFLNLNHRRTTCAYLNRKKHLPVCVNKFVEILTKHFSTYK